MNINIINEILYLVLTLLFQPPLEVIYHNQYDSEEYITSYTYEYIVTTEDIYVRKGALDWFEEVQFVFPRNTNATVRDIETGKTFRVKRTFGTNHADVEPLTKEDSAIIKEIWGGSWSWERRAVVVKPDSGQYVIAGSMTGYPHAGLNDYPPLATVNNRSGGFGRGQNFDVVKGNGVDGHFDIHFLNSRTHGTNTMQAEHQNMVQRAALYIATNY